MRDAVEHGRQARRFAEGHDLAAYEADAPLRSAVERKLMIVGEALAQLNRVYPDVARRITVLRDVIAFRTIRVHGYGVVADERVWNIVQHFLAALDAELENLLSDPDLD